MLQHWHQCKSCNAILNGGSDYAKRNTIFMSLKKYEDNNELANVLQAFHFHIVRLEKTLQSAIKDRVREKILQKLFMRS